MVTTALLLIPVLWGAEVPLQEAESEADSPPPAPEGKVIPRYEKGEWKQVPIEPRYETDFTAYTVGRGFFRLGPMNLDYGLLDNTQVGTSPWLWVYGIANIRAKVTAIQTETFDLSAEVMGMGLDASDAGVSDELLLYAYPVTLTGSWILADTLSLHGGWRWELVDVQGAFELETLAGALAEGLGVDLTEELEAGLDGSGALYGGAHVSVSQLRLGFDIRFNRRDSLVVLARRYMVLRGRVDAGYETEDESLSVGAAAHIVEPLEGYMPAVTTVAWQFTWPRVRLRIGLPLSGGDTLPMLWIPQAFEVCLRV